LRRFLVSLRYCSATFVRPGATADDIRILSSAAVAPGRAKASTSAASRISVRRKERLLDARSGEERLAFGAAQIAHEGARDLEVRCGSHRGRRVSGVVLDVGRQRTDELQPLVAL